MTAETSTVTREFRFEKGSTCKELYIFTLSDGADGPVIENLDIVPHKNPTGGEQGCQGHPQTIMALVKGQPIKFIPADALAAAGCGMELSCGQSLAKCLRELAS